MDEIKALANEISQQIYKSDEYQEYQQALKVIYADEQLLERIERFKQQHLQFLYAMQNGTATFEQERYLSQEFHKLILKKEVKVYFNYGLKAVEMLTCVFDEIAKDLNIDLNFRG